MRFRVSAPRHLFFPALFRKSDYRDSGDVSLGMAPEPSLGQTCIRLEIRAHQRRRIQTYSSGSANGNAISRLTRFNPVRVSKKFIFILGQFARQRRLPDRQESFWVKLTGFAM